MKEKQKVLLRKIFLLTFLALIVIGFSVPTFFLGNTPQENSLAEPNICQSDADCYLLCDSGPVAVLCSQNLCQQNACNEFSAYPYSSEAKQAMMSVIIDGQEIPLKNANEKDFFVTFSENKVQLFSSGLSLQQIMEKAGMLLTPDCLTVNGTAYCTKNDKELQILANDAHVAPLYPMKAGDVVKIEYGQVPETPSNK
ncbi:MAG: hypothetical protein Q8R53_06370 [Nanoarchaeota archaeon]|nr:hypothetical protein [Nanoarchaeota archaeon]